MKTIKPVIYSLTKHRTSNLAIKIKVLDFHRLIGALVWFGSGALLQAFYFGSLLQQQDVVVQHQSQAKLRPERNYLRHTLQSESEDCRTFHFLHSIGLVINRNQCAIHHVAPRFCLSHQQRTENMRSKYAYRHVLQLRVVDTICKWIFENYLIPKQHSTKGPIKGWDRLFRQSEICFNLATSTK